MHDPALAALLRAHPAPPRRPILGLVALHHTALRLPPFDGVEDAQQELAANEALVAEIYRAIAESEIPLP